MSKSCEKCGKLVDSSDKYCPHCGNAVNIKTATSVCPKCNHNNPKGALFCEKCGASLMETEPAKNEKSGPKTFSSAGNYSGNITKGKTSEGWKIFRNTIIGIVLLGIFALIIWFQVDPEAGKKLTDVLTGIGFMLVFPFFGWLFMRGKKGRKSGWDDDQFAVVDNDNDYDSDDDD